MSTDAGWTDRQRDAGSTWRAVWSRITGDAENPMGWGFTVARLFGVRVRISLWFVLYAAAQIIWSISLDNIGVAFVAIQMAVLFGLVLLHEFGHVFACRAVGGDADDVLLWPLGGLAACQTPPHWRADLITTLGGPLVNVALLPVFAGALWVIGADEHILFNPLTPGVTLGALQGWGAITLWTAHFLNIILLAFNLLPMFPLDGGRIVHALAWRRTDERRGRDLAASIGLVGAIVLAVVSLPSRETTILGVAIFAGLVCWFERQRVRQESEIIYGAMAAPGDEMREYEAQRRAAEKQREREAKEQAELDRILAKIAATGMDSLTRTERRTLEQATERRRGG